LSEVHGYSPDSLEHVEFFSFYYQFRIDHRDEHYYPLKGYYADLTFTQNGLFSKTINVPYIELSARRYWQIFNRWYFATGLFAKISLNLDQPYFLQRGLGYGRTYVRGYEYYIIDGQHFALLKNNLKFAILPKKVFVMEFLKSEKFNTVPVALYLNVFTDLGYVYNYSQLSNSLNSLQNSLLVGYGAGFDFTTYYDIVMRIEFSMNGFGKPGIYLHFMAPI
jgi:outer membrane protein assembly factor BamA